MISGKYIECQIGTTPIAGVMEWEAEGTTDKLDGSTGASLGYEESDFGLSRLHVRMNLIQDLSTGVYSDVVDGTRIANLKLYRSGDDALPAFLIPEFNVFRAVTRGAVNDKFTVSCEGDSNGIYTYNDPGATA